MLERLCLPKCVQNSTSLVLLDLCDRLRVNDLQNIQVLNNHDVHRKIVI